MIRNISQACLSYPDTRKSNQLPEEDLLQASQGFGGCNKDKKINLELHLLIPFHGCCSQIENAIKN